MTPKKLIRSGVTDKLKPGEWEEITNLDELNKLYVLKVLEELEEIKASKFSDVFEFVDLIQVAIQFAAHNGVTDAGLQLSIIEKTMTKGIFERLALNNLNPNNPSNRLYFAPKKICYCGSLRFIDKFKEAECQSVIDGNIALLPWLHVR